MSGAPLALGFLALTSCGPQPVEPASVPVASERSGSTGVEDSGRSTDTGAAERLGLLSLNLHCLRLDGTGYADNDARFAAIADAVSRGGADVLALQEVCVQGEVDALEELRAALIVATGDPWEGRYAFAHTAWEGTPDEAQEGVGLLSRRGLGSPTELPYVDPGELRRVGLFATLDDGTTVATVHLDHGSGTSREAQARQTASQVLAASAGLDVLVAGDLNGRAGGPAHGAFLSMGFLDLSGELSSGAIDFAFAHRGSRWSAERAELWFEEEPVSDHAGVFVSLVAGVPEEVPRTRVVAHVDVGYGHTLSVRGDAEPLSWDRGWWAWPAAGERWELVLTEIDTPFAYKTLVDDVSWQTGEDMSGAVGVDNEVRPSF